ncbi:STAS domain-containing protein [Marinobacter salinexigens]|uniref:STAS domain-containing protein n=1 Tax=Marinobacter salinexigens TaxID=2919747 RepID=A0A5B0VP32_9GAMM|nr:STAS domain-containing protein [Marinobacter salinexigens]KAA1176366.1 STAS domain-containing protein [Marinobacter salinexigens]
MSTRSPGVELSHQVLSVTGNVAVDQVVALRKEGETLIGTVSGSLTVDLSELETAHSVILSMLLCWQRYARQQGVSLIFQGVSDRLSSLAALSNIDEQLGGFAHLSSSHPH